MGNGQMKHYQHVKSMNLKVGHAYALQVHWFVIVIFKKVSFKLELVLKSKFFLIDCSFVLWLLVAQLQ